MKTSSQLAAILTLAGAFHAQAGTISYQAIPATQSDANCGITEENNEYTTAVDGGNMRGTDRVINGITLDTLAGTGRKSTADNCTLTALSGTLANVGATKSIPADGTFNEVMSDMTVNNGAGDNSQQEIVLDPESLEEGESYDLRVYICNSSGQNRQVNLAFFGDGQDAAETGFFNEDDARTSAGKFKDPNQVYYINYRYTWDGESTPGITITQKSGAAPFCLYALTNQVALAGAAAEQSGYDPGFAFVDMNKIFKDYGKTKDAEAKINEAKNDAKKKYDERAAKYKKDLDELNEMNRLIGLTTNEAAKAEMTRNRDNKIPAIKESEREINAWRAAREKELQDQALKLRTEIVAEITASIKKLGGENVDLILDGSGNSLNGVPFVVHYPPTADMSDRVTSALAGRQSTPFASTHDLKIAVVNMNDVFKNLNKTKTSEAKINSAKETAKKEYDKKAEKYKKELGAVPSSPGTARDNQVSKVKEMEREINEWRAAREKELQDQALKMRTELVAEITKEIKGTVVADDLSVVLDVSGLSLNGVPAIVSAIQVPDLSNQVVAALNQTSGKSRKRDSSETTLVSSTKLRFGGVDMDRVFKAMPETKQAETEINNLKEKAKPDLANVDAKAREAKEKELQDVATKKREPIVQKVTAGVRKFAEATGFNLVFDTSGNSLNGVPLLVSKHDLPDVTAQVISQLTSSR